MLGNRQRVETEPHLAFVGTVDETIDRRQCARPLDGQLGRVERAVAEIGQKVDPVVAVCVERDDSPCDNDGAGQNRQDQPTRTHGRAEDHQHQAAHADRDRHAEALDGCLRCKSYRSWHRLVRGAE